MVCKLLFADGGVLPTGNILLEIKDENGAFIDGDNLECKIWSDDITGYSYSSALTFNVSGSTDNVHIDYLELTSPNIGIFEIETSEAFSGAATGNVINIWVHKTTSTVQEGLIQVPLTDETYIELTDSDALYLTSDILPQTYGGGQGLTGTYTYNSYPTRGINDACQVIVELPAGSAGNLTAGAITVGLLSQKPGTVPSQGINFGFYFDTKDLTTLGSGNIAVTIKWLGDIGLSGTIASDQGLYLSEDGIYWVNTMNVTYPEGISLYGTSVPDYTTTSGQVSFDIDHIPHSIVFGDGADGTSEYTETTPPQPVGLTAIINGSDLNLAWNKSPQPGVSYDVQEYISSTWTDPLISGTIGNTSTQKTYSAAGISAESKFYRAEVSNNSGEISYSQPMGYVKYVLATGWNMVGYTMGENGYTVNSLYDDITGIQAAGIKIWNKDTQAWVTYNDGSTKALQKGDVFLVNVTSTPTWYSAGTAYGSDGAYHYDFEFNDSGYNMIILPFDKASITTTSALFTDIFGRGRFTIDHTLSWYNASEGAFVTYDGGDIGNIFDSSLRIGVPLIVHIAASDDITWPDE